MALIPASLTVFDTETTGVDTDTCRIVTAFVARMDTATGALTEMNSWLINPGVPIEQGASDVHGITDEVAQTQGMDAATAIAEIVARLNAAASVDSPVTAFNARFDLTLLDREARRYGIEPFTPGVVIDPYVLDKQVDKYRRGRRTLSVTTEHYGISLIGAHDAEADATATGLLAVKLLEKMPAGTNLDELHRLQTAWAAGQAAGLQDYFRKTNPDAFVEGRWPLVPFAA